jgi:hypothetical protein
MKQINTDINTYYFAFSVTLVVIFFVIIFCCCCWKRGPCSVAVEQEEFDNPRGIHPNDIEMHHNNLSNAEVKKQITGILGKVSAGKYSAKKKSWEKME